MENGPLVLEGVEITAPDGRPLIRSASLVFEPGVTTLVGSNGSGKSTLLRAIFGLHPLRAGRLRLGPYDHRRDRRAFLDRAVFMPQNFCAYPELSGREFLAYFLGLRGLAKAAADARARQWLTAVGLEQAGENATGTYSPGMLQRLGLAYVLQSGAPLRVLDEPFAGVDPDARAALMDLLCTSSSQHITIVCTHHVQEMAERGARAARLHDGALAGPGPTG